MLKNARGLGSLLLSDQQEDAGGQDRGAGNAGDGEDAVIHPVGINHIGTRDRRRIPTHEVLIHIGSVFTDDVVVTGYTLSNIVIRCCIRFISSEKHFVVIRQFSKRILESIPSFDAWGSDPAITKVSRQELFGIRFSR